MAARSHDMAENGARVLTSLKGRSQATVDRAHQAGMISAELCGKVGDGVNQAADLISATPSIPSLNFIPLTTFGNWF